MNVLLSDGCGLASRQAARLLHQAGHRVGVLTPDRLCVCGLTRTVHRVHLVPRAADGPDAWLEAAIAAYGDGYDVLLPTQEQVAVLSRHADRLAAAGIRTVVPDFDAFAAVFDKVTARATLDRLGVPQPPSSVVTGVDEVERYPVFAKLPVATASSGVQRVSSAAELTALIATWRAEGRLTDGPILAQEPADGPLAMVQAVFDHGRLVAAHVNERVREGIGGGASHKRSLDRPDAVESISRLGTGLGWHGALSADVILAADGPLVIDVNPRLVEPANAAASGVDLVGPLVELATGGTPTRQRPSRPGVRTHQTLLAVLGTADRTGTRRAVAREAFAALRHRGAYEASTEELTPLRGNWRGTAPTVAAAVMSLISPSLHRRFVSGSTDAYALGPAAWATLLDGVPVT
ncbi:MAG: ATP-grasp domain-containing protein [Ilumatobacteraceae bacterium]